MTRAKRRAALWCRCRQAQWPNPWTAGTAPSPQL